MNTFRITQPGSFVNRRGDRVEIENSLAQYWQDLDGYCYHNDGVQLGQHVSDIVGVWTEPPVSCESVNILEYDLSEIWQRFKALADGRSLQHSDDAYGVITYDLSITPIGIMARKLVREADWSLVPLAPVLRKVVCKECGHEHEEEV